MDAQDIISSGILELYATGLASAEEVSQVQHYVSEYPEVAAELEQIEAGMESYARVFSLELSSNVKDKIFARINADEITAGAPVNGTPSSAKVVNISYWKFAAAAAVVLLLGSIALNVLMYNKNSYAATKLQNVEQELASLKEENNLMASDMNVVQNKYSKPVSLKGLEASPGAAAKIFWMENTGEVYLDPSNLPEAPSGKQYQLWAIVDGKPVDGGMIATSKQGDKYRIQKMKTFGKVDAFAVTLESEKGNTSPKGPMYVMGKM